MAALALLALSGCTQAPSLNVLGSYFPSWMLCVLIAGIATVIMRQLFAVIGIDAVLPAPLLVYLLLLAALSFAIWLAWLG